MWCCALIPLGLFLVVGPMFAAGRGGLRPFLVSLGTGWAMVVLVAVLNGPATLDLLEDWRENLSLLLPFVLLLFLSVVMGGLVVFARGAENRWPDRGKCRRCGYDLRASPQRCPECGTPTRGGPERV